MFVRSKTVKGRKYYQVIETYRDGGKVRHRTIVSLGQHPTIEDAYQETLFKWKCCGGKLGEPPMFWDRLVLLDRLREKPHGWAEALRKQQQDWRAFDEPQARLDEARILIDALLRSSDPGCFRVLGLTVPATVAQIKTAYRQ